VVWGIESGELLVIGYLFLVNEGKKHYAAVGDCVATPKSGELVHVACGAPGALKVLAKFTGDDSNRCDGVSGTTQAFVEYPKGEASFVLCAGAAK
jgi:hypothetical protein